MSSAQPRNSERDASPDLLLERPWLSAQWLANALLVLLVALVSAQLMFLHAPVCHLQMGFTESAILAMGVLFAGAVFNWVSIDLLLSEALLLDGHFSITLSNLASVILMAGAIRAVSMALQARRWDIAGIAWLIVASATVGLYAVLSVFGFCVTSRTWHI